VVIYNTQVTFQTIIIDSKREYALISSFVSDSRIIEIATYSAWFEAPSLCTFSFMLFFNVFFFSKDP